MNEKKAKWLRREVKRLQKKVNPSMQVGATYTERDPKTGVIRVVPCVRLAYQNTKRRMQSGV